MKSAFVAASLLAFLFASSTPRAAAQNGAIQFVVQATPSSGIAEPVRGFPISLLSKSFADIGKEVEATTPKPDQDAFIDRLTVSKEMKAWMKKNHTVRLSGDAFVHSLHSADIMGVPEFFDSYMQRNSGDEFVSFPKPKYKPADKVKDPEKYEKLHKEYLEAIQRYIDINPQSIEGIDLGLAEKDPGAQWDSIVAKRAPEVRHQTLLLARSKYLVAQTQTDLQGQGFFPRVPPGTYWISSLDVSADVGDVRPRWDVPVNVLAGQTVYITLNEANSVQPVRTSP